MSELTPNQIADHLAKLLAKPLPKSKVKPKKKTGPKGKPGRPKKSTFPKETKTPETLTLKLFGQHRINGFPYGPGTVTVPYALGEVLREADQRARIHDETWQQPRAVIVGPNASKGSGHQTRTVSPTMFDSPTLNIPEAGFAHSSGQFTDPF